MSSDRNIIIVSIVVLILLIISFFFLFVMQQSDPQEKSEMKQAPLPASVTNEIESTRSDEHSYFSRWESDPINHTVNIYLNCIPLLDTKADKRIDNWTIMWVQDPEIYNETAFDQCEDFIDNWVMDHPHQRVGSWSPNSCKKTVYVKVINITPEILGSEAMVEGWRIVFVRAT